MEYLHISKAASEGNQAGGAAVKGHCYRERHHPFWKRTFGWGFVKMLFIYIFRILKRIPIEILTSTFRSSSFVYTKGYPSAQKRPLFSGGTCLLFSYLIHFR